MNKILFELGFEELPVNEIKILFEYFKKNFLHSIDNYNIKYETVEFYNTPRRLSVIIDNMDEKTPIKTVECKGPPKNVFYGKNGISEQGKGFLKSKSLKEDDIKIKNGIIYYTVKKGGECTLDILKNIISNLLKKVPFTKTMKWADSDIRFSRPIRWIVFINNDSIVDYEFAGIKAGDQTYINRSIDLMPIKITYKNYIDILKKHFVMLDNDIENGNRYQYIVNQINNIEKQYNIKIIKDNELIIENTLLTEYPVLNIASFDKRFLNLPSPILIAAMKQHQRYFSIKDKNDKLINMFLFVFNNPEADAEVLKKNNKKVLIARLEDAEFYYNNDLKLTLNQYEEKLKDIVFYNNLGTYYDKIKRLSELCNYINNLLNKQKIDWKHLSIMAKFDIATEMIKDGKEFTELQGIIGYYYLQKMGFDKDTCLISKEHYLPKTKNDVLPSDYKSTILSIADKIDNITGAFIAGYKPTGSKDIMAVRRDSIALIYLLHSIQNRHNLIVSIDKLIEQSLKIYNHYEKDIEKEICKYIDMRMENYCSDLLNISIDIIRAVINSKSKIIGDIIKKIELLNNEKQNENFKILVIGMKRASNIIKDFSPEKTVNDYTYSEKYEIELLNNAKKIEKHNKILYEKKQFESILKNLLSLREHIDAFFDNVLVMHSDIEIKNKRMTLLYYVKEIFEDFADFSKIVFAKKV